MSFFNFFNKQTSSTNTASSPDEDYARHKERVTAFNHFVESIGPEIKKDPFVFLLLGLSFVGAAKIVDDRQPNESLEQAKERAIEERSEFLMKNHIKEQDHNRIANRLFLDMAVLSATAAGADWAASNPIKK